MQPEEIRVMIDIIQKKHDKYPSKPVYCTVTRSNGSVEKDWTIDFSDGLIKYLSNNADEVLSNSQVNYLRKNDISALEKNYKKGMNVQKNIGGKVVEKAVSMETMYHMNKSRITWNNNFN